MGTTVVPFPAAGARLAATCHCTGRRGPDRMDGVNDQVITIRGEEELTARAGHLFPTAKQEFVCAATDMNTWSRPTARAAITHRMRPVIGGGLVVRKLYTPAALTDDEQRGHLVQVASVGAHVRICAAGLPHETIII